MRAEAQAEALPEIVPLVEPELAAAKTVKDVQSQISPRAEAATVAVLERGPGARRCEECRVRGSSGCRDKGDVPVVEPAELPIAG